MVGLERSQHFKEAGVRTHVIVCCTAALIMLISKYGFADMGSSSVMEAFGKDKEDYRAIGTFLVFTADTKESLSNSEYHKAIREVDDVAIGRYEQEQKRGYSMKM